jgi:pimeloyl-ACP methyl ester carboxylesterase
VKCAYVVALLSALSACVSAAATETPPPEAFRVLQETLPPGPRITPFLQYQAEQAWRFDDARRKSWESIRDEATLLKTQAELRRKLLEMIGGLPETKTDLRPQITGKIAMEGFSIEKVIFQSLPGVYVTALVYVPEDHSRKHPAVLVPAGHATDGKVHYQALSQRLVQRGYVVISWDPVGQAERSQFWDAAAGKSRYNLICAEHAVLGNLAYLAGANLARWEIWDGIRAVDYLLTRLEVDPDRISISGTSGGGTQTALIAALDPRIKVAVPSCFITALPMRVYNRIFADPDSDPEQDLFGMVAQGIDHPGLLLLMYPRPVLVAAAVLDYFPIEGTHKTVREMRDIYERFHHGDRIGMVESYNTHQFSTDNQKAALEFLDRFNNMPLSRALPAVKELDAKTLLCTKTGQALLDFNDARPLTELIRDYYREHKSTHPPSIAKQYFGREYAGVKDWRLTEYKGAPPRPGEITWEATGQWKSQNVSIDRYLLRHSDRLEMPLVYIHKKGANSEKTLLWFRKDGKASASDWPIIESYADQGYDVVSFDFRGLGETRMPYKAVSPDDPLLGKLDFDEAYANSISGVLGDYVYNSLLVGRPYFLQMIEDAEIAKRFTQEKLGAKSIAVTAPGDASFLASAIVEVFPDVKLTATPGSNPLKWSEIVEQKREIWPIQYLLPGGAYIH